MWQLQGFDSEQFLREYWQRKPLLLRQAFAGLDPMLSPDELAGLACEQEVYSRLVIEKDAATPWQLSYGPFDEMRFTELPMTHYSLLVSECEKWMPELRELLSCFDFIPRWRIDDLMISYAPDQGSVGPHTDEYDVFLIQTSGTRRWSIENNRNPSPELIPDLDLAIMRDFNPDQSWLLEPGDLLYLPPQIPHHGVAVGSDCMTWSVGFRAPTLGDIGDSFMLEADQRGLAAQRYRDADLTGPRNPAQITDTDVHSFREMLARLLDQPGDLWTHAVGKLVSDVTLDESSSGPSIEAFADLSDTLLVRHPDSRIFYYQGEQDLILFYNGHAANLVRNTPHLEFCLELCDWQPIEPTIWENRLDQAAQDLLVDLVHQGIYLEINPHEYE